MTYLDNKKNFIFRDHNDIIIEIGKRRNIIKNFYSFFKKNKLPIFKEWLNDIKNWVCIKDQYTFNYNSHRLEMIISKSYIPQILKIESFISFFFNLNEKIMSYNIEFNLFIQNYIEAFENLDLEDNNFIKKFKKFSVFLIKLIRKKLEEEISYNLVYNYISLLRLIFPLLNLGKFSKEIFIQFFSIFDKFSIEYDLIEKYKILIDYYNEIEENQDSIRNLVFHFLKTHKRKELFNKYYPDPIKFCEYFENKFKNKTRNFVFNTYLEYYKSYTTNFILPLFLKRKNLNNPKVLKIIYNNLQSEKFTHRDLDRFFERIIKIKLEKKNFILFCQTISALKAQIFIFNYYKIYKLRNLDLSQKYTLISYIVSFRPDFYRNKSHPASHQYLISKKKFLKNKKILKAYFRLILKLEDYSDFKTFWSILSIENKNLRKKFIKISKHSWKKLLGKIEKILDLDEFSLLKCLKEIFKKEFYNIYKLKNYKSLAEYVLKELNSNSKHLKIFLFEQFITTAEKYNDVKTDKKLFLEFQILNRTIYDDDKTIYDFFYEFSYESYNENYLIELKHLYTLIKSKEKNALYDFINDLIEKEHSKQIKNHEKLGVLYFIKGEFQNSCNSIEKAISDLNITSFHKENLTNSDEKLNNLKNFQKIISLEQNFKNYGSIQDLLKDIDHPLTYLKNNLHKYICYFLNFEIYKHYHNIYIFLKLLYDFEKHIDENKKWLINLLDYLYVDTIFCIEWDDIKRLWNNKIIREFEEKNLLKFAEEQCEIFNKNPLFSGLKVFLETIQKPGSYLYFLFNYDPSNLIHNFKEKYQTLNNIFNKKYRNSLFLPLKFEDIDEFSNLHIPFKNSFEKFDTFILTLYKTIIDSINVKLLKSELGLPKKRNNLGKLNLTKKFIREKLVTDNTNIENIISGFKELNDIRSYCGIAHKRGRKYKKKLKKYSLQGLSNIDISKKIVSDLIKSFTNLVEIFG